MTDDVIVVKLGGSVPPGPVLDDVAAHAASGAGTVLVHGGGPEADRLAERLGAPLGMVVSPDGTRGRRTDAAALDVVTMALLGRVKPALVGGLRARGVVACGLSGADGALVTAERKSALRSIEGDRVRLIRDDRSGRVTEVRTGVLRALLDAGAVPVVSPPAADADGGLLNVDSDQVAARVAVALGARALVLLTDAPGVLRDERDPGSLVSELDRLPGCVTGRMRHKVRAALLARRGVPLVVVGSGRAEHPVEAALLGKGTVVASEPGEDA